MPSPYDFEDYKMYLAAVLEHRRRRNRAYSARSLATACGVSSSYFSRVLSGERAPSAALASRICRTLDLTCEETVYFLNLMELDRAESGPEKKRIERMVATQRRRGKQSAVDTEDFIAIADWYHFAILALAQTADFKPHPKWIARRLGITPEEAETAVQRLLDLKLLLQDGEAFQIANGGYLETEHDVSLRAVRENHRQHLRLAEKSLMQTPVEKREFSNVSIALHEGDIPKAKKKIRLFLDRFIQEMERTPGTEVFQFNLQFYQLTQRGPA